ncbi:MAG: type III-A CRISPR-associated RAMP protein Csm5 [Geminicoccaceae bacterium]
MSVHRFTAIPLTPIHIGDGTLLAPEDYLLEDDKVARFVPARVLADMGPGLRRRFLQALEAGQLDEAQGVLREAVDPERHVVERIGLSGAARQRLNNVFRHPLQRGEVRPFVRTGGRPYLPGSSLKGALRTALLNHFAQARQPEVDRALDEARVRDARPGLTGNRAAALVQTAFAMPPRRLEADPLRFVEVGDVTIAADRTRIDLVENWKPARRDQTQRQGSIPMQVERLLSRADGLSISLDLRVALHRDRAEAGRKLDAGKVPRDGVDLAVLLHALNAFYWTRWDEELSTFFADDPTTTALLADCFRIKAGADQWTLGFVRDRPADFALLRLGRFTQFESKSVDIFREGWSPQGRRSLKEGNTRNIVRLRDRSGRDVLVPLGWILLVRRS